MIAVCRTHCDAKAVPAAFGIAEPGLLCTPGASARCRFGVVSHHRYGHAVHRRIGLRRKMASLQGYSSPATPLIIQSPWSASITFPLGYLPATWAGAYPLDTTAASGANRRGTPNCVCNREWRLPVPLYCLNHDRVLSELGHQLLPAPVNNSVHAVIAFDRHFTAAQTAPPLAQLAWYRPVASGWWNPSQHSIGQSSLSATPTRATPIPRIATGHGNMLVLWRSRSI